MNFGLRAYACCCRERPAADRGALHERDEIELERFRERDRPAAGERMRRRHDQHERNAAIRNDVQPVGRLEVADNADVSAPLRDAFNDRQALAFVEADLYRGALCDVAREVRNQDDDRGLVRQNPDIGRIVRGKRAERIGYSVERLDDLARMADERFTRGGRDDSRVLAHEQRDSELGLEIADALARRRRDDVLALCGSCDAAVVDHADEEL